MRPRCTLIQAKVWSRFHVSQAAAGSCLPGIHFLSRLQRRRIGCGTIADNTSGGDDPRTCTVRCALGGNGFAISAGSCANHAAATCGTDGHRRWARSRSEHPNSNPNTYADSVTDSDSRTHSAAAAFSNADPNPNTSADPVTDSNTHSAADAFSNADPNPNTYADSNTHSLADSNSHADNRPTRDVRRDSGPGSLRSQEPR